MSNQKVLTLISCAIGFYALFKWKQSDNKLQTVSGYLKGHVQYHKDNNIPFGPN